MAHTSSLQLYRYDTSSQRSSSSNSYLEYDFYARILAIGSFVEPEFDVSIRSISLFANDQKMKKLKKNSKTKYELLGFYSSNTIYTITELLDPNLTIKIVISWIPDIENATKFKTVSEISSLELNRWAHRQMLLRNEEPFEYPISTEMTIQTGQYLHLKPGSQFGTIWLKYSNSMIHTDKMELDHFLRDSQSWESVVEEIENLYGDLIGNFYVIEDLHTLLLKIYDMPGTFARVLEVLCKISLQPVLEPIFIYEKILHGKFKSIGARKYKKSVKDLCQEQVINVLKQDQVEIENYPNIMKRLIKVQFKRVLVHPKVTVVLKKDWMEHHTGSYVKRKLRSPCVGHTLNMIVYTIMLLMLSYPYIYPHTYGGLWYQKHMYYDGLYDTLYTGEFEDMQTMDDFWNYLEDVLGRVIENFGEENMLLLELRTINQKVEFDKCDDGTYFCYENMKCDLSQNNEILLEFNSIYHPFPRSLPSEFSKCLPTKPVENSIFYSKERILHTATNDSYCSPCTWQYGLNESRHDGFLDGERTRAVLVGLIFSKERDDDHISFDVTISVEVSPIGQLWKNIYYEFHSDIENSNELFFIKAINYVFLVIIVGYLFREVQVLLLHGNSYFTDVFNYLNIFTLVIILITSSIGINNSGGFWTNRLFRILGSTSAIIRLLESFGGLFLILKTMEMLKPVPYLGTLVVAFNRMIKDILLFFVLGVIFNWAFGYALTVLFGDRLRSFGNTFQSTFWVLLLFLYKLITE
eukprot:TRINITY_DN2299_c0_g1_i8.p1 TRINITY_DN2299_c0_g1~~TRINITY_DN2299_c0_g1_i8.p1  ORF type:complete len:760 (-),score=110.50 TRINITY_DN2299_c0_g1_i8:383-2629(-)